MEIYFDQPDLRDNYSSNEAPKKVEINTPDSFQLPYLEYTFDLPLHPRQIKYWRGAVAGSAGIKNDLFHNHDNRSDEEKNHNGAYRIRYPQVQFRSKGGKAAIWAIGDGVPAVRKWLSKVDWAQFEIGNEKLPIKIINFEDGEHTLELTKNMQTYRLLDWVALNSENYRRWQQADDLISRVELLNEVLTGQLLGFASAAGWQLPERLEVKLLSLKNIKPVKIHDYTTMAFNVIYKTNLTLPPGMSVGRNKAFGYGVQQPIKSEK